MDLQQAQALKKGDLLISHRGDRDVECLVLSTRPGKNQTDYPEVELSLNNIMGGPYSNRFGSDRAQEGDDFEKLTPTGRNILDPSFEAQHWRILPYTRELVLYPSVTGVHYPWQPLRNPLGPFNYAVNRLANAVAWKLLGPVLETAQSTLRQGINLPSYAKN